MHLLFLVLLSHFTNTLDNPEFFLHLKMFIDYKVKLEWMDFKVKLRKWSK